VIYRAANILSTDNTNNGVQSHRNTVVYRAANILSTDNTNNGVQSHRNTVVYRAANILSTDNSKNGVQSHCNEQKHCDISGCYILYSVNINNGVQFHG
jgi:accessory colonization factor AcfC